ncbi:RNase A-like domain-containing protein [Nocardioides caricicola]|uniref:RNase A-like domain-containing protein n=1 Tax=Nocardioides caricicola TaxID=634770 RepID=A0ABW0N311_9ACTN
MRVAVLGQGYAGAVEAFVSGNLLAADACAALADRLAGCGGMAGDDATAGEFAASYDEAAAEALAALGDLVGAFGSLGRLAQASLTNHHGAEVASGGSVSSPPTRADDSVGMLVAVPPTSLGGDAASVPGPVAWVLDQIEGVVWPDADTDRLRSAAGSWRTAAGAVSLLTAHCDTALGDLADERSPEIPLAVATTEELRTRAASLSDQLAAIGLACEAYADQVDAKRDEMLDLLTDLSIELAATAVVGGALSVISGGLAAPAAGAVGSARLAWASRELKLIVDSLRLLTTGTAGTLRPVSLTLRDARAYFSRLRAARPLVRTERGSIRMGREHRSLLERHEGARRGHALERHFGKSDHDLMARVLSRGGPRRASTFSERAVGERLIERQLRSRSEEIREWMTSNSDDYLILEDGAQRVIGRIADRITGMMDATGLRTVLAVDDTMPEGYRIITSYPIP